MRRPTTTSSCWSREDDVAEPELSIVIPALNEELTIGDFVDWCQEGLRDGRRRRRDPDRRQLRPTAPPRSRSPAAPACCSTPKRGLGRAYIDALPFIRGQYVAHGRRRLHLRLPRARAVRRALPRGLRVRDGLALAGLHRARRDAAAAPYFGTPVTTWILNVLYSAASSRDIHCGMRGITRDALRAHGSAVAVVGVRVGDGAQVGAHGAAHRPRCRSRFLKDREGRLSHHKRVGLVLAVGRPPGSTCARCSSTAPTSSSSSRAWRCSRSACC